MGLLARLSHKKKSGSRLPDAPGDAVNPSFRGVTVRPNNEACCQFVRTLADERFLAEEAPMLPLSLCDAALCHCTFERFDDRRAAIRRASDLAFDIASELHDRENRSFKLPGRRSEDKLENGL